MRAPVIITYRNWFDGIDAAISSIESTMVDYPSGTLERSLLVSEAAALRELKDYVSACQPAQRQEKLSTLLTAATRDGLSLPAPVIELVGSVYDVYRRWKNDPVALT